MSHPSHPPPVPLAPAGGAAAMQLDPPSSQPPASAPPITLTTDHSPSQHSPRSAPATASGTSPTAAGDGLSVRAEEEPAAAEDSLQPPIGGTLLGWGCGMFSLLGGGKDESNRSVPTRFPNFNSLVTSVATGSAHVLATAADGTLYSWGTNDEGQLGLGDRQARDTPTELPSLQTRRIVGAAAGYAHSFALASTGEALAFGAGEMATLGLTMRKRPAGTPPDLAAHPKPGLVKELSQLTRVIQVACGDTHTLALSSSGRVYAVGDGSRGALGLDFGKSTHVNPKGGAVEGAGVRVAVFTEVSSLLPIPIASIAAGSHHSLFVGAAGSVYSSGDSSKGRLGYVLPAASGTVQWLPRRITGELEERFVMSASAGAQFSLFLTQQYTVYATGSNAHGEAGLNGAVIKQLDSPQLVPGLPRILQISAGSTHALARDAQNRCWSWGSNETCELGRGEGAELCNSTAVGLVALPQVYPHQHIVSVTAGSNCSFAIVAQTVLTTNVNTGPASPHRIVPSAVGSSQAAAAPATYSLATPAASDVDAAEMQVDFSASAAAAASSSASSSSSSSNCIAAPPSATPQYIVPPSSSPLPLNAFSFAHFSSLLRKKDWNGLLAYVSFVFSSALVLNASFLPRAAAGGGSHIDHAMLEVVYAKIVKTFLHEKRMQQTLASSLQKMVSSMVLLMKATGRQPPHDIAAYRAVIIAFQSPHLLAGGMAETSVLSDISFILTRMPRDVAEKLKTHLWQKTPFELLRTRFIRVLLKNIERRFQQALHGHPINVRLRQASDDVIDLVKILDGVHQVVERRTQEQRAVRGRHHGHGLLLEDTTRVANDAAASIPETAWHLPLDRYIDLASDLINFVSPAPTPAQLPPFAFARYKWLLSPATKAAYLRVEFAYSMQQQALGAMLLAESPQLQLKIRRTHLVEDTVNAINRHNVNELRKPLKIQFQSAGGAELGEDAGGLTAEFFELVFRELHRPQFALWEARPEWKSVWFSSRPIDPSKSSLYQIFGILLGMLLYNGNSASLNFPSLLWAQLLGMQPTLQHLHAVDPMMADSLQELLDFTGDVENTFCLNFSVDVPERTEAQLNMLQLQASRTASGNNNLLLSPIARDSSMQVDSTPPATPVSAEDKAAAASVAAADGADQQLVVSVPRMKVRNVPLLPGGEDIAVTQANKAQYVAAYLQWLFRDSVIDAIKPLIEGFQSICAMPHAGHRGAVAMQLFTPADLELVVVGTKTLNFADLKRTVRYEGYSSDSPVVQHFWRVVLGPSSDPLTLTAKEQKQLLLFTTGSSRAPVGGLADINMVIQRAGPDTDALPTSSTCFHMLLLPEYSSVEKLSAKMKLALANAVGFGLR